MSSMQRNIFLKLKNYLNQTVKIYYIKVEYQK